MKLKACLKSMRLRTLPLSLSGIAAGVCMVINHGQVGPATVAFLVLTTAALQVLSNLSNELGDCLHGTDDGAERLGIHYSIMDGEMSVPEMKRLIAGVAVSCCVFGLLMIWSSFGTLFSLHSLLFVALGACAIAAALKYTLGSNPYGYRGLGDVFVFIFFGLVTVLGAAYICSHDITVLSVCLLPACAIGCFSIGVLNVNNIRDMQTDAKTRLTVALRLGEHNAKVYQTVLTVLGWGLMTAYSIVNGGPWLHFVTLPLFAIQLKGVWERSGKALDPMLPLLVVSTFAMSLVFGLSLVL